MHQSKFNLSSSRFVSSCGGTPHSLLQQQNKEREKRKSPSRPSPSSSDFLMEGVANCKPEDDLSWSSSSSLSSTTHSDDGVLEEPMFLLPPSPISTPRSHHRQRPRRVTFDRVEIVELSVELGDHPCCRRGPALRMSGRVQGQMSMPLKDFEEERSPRRRSPRKLCLSSNERMRILRLNVSIPSLLNREEDSDPPPRTNSEWTSRTRNDWSDPEQRMLKIDKLMNDLLVRMDALDHGLAQQRKQQQHRGKGRMLQEQVPH